ncbi:hypothetical protein ZWY2020_051585 [Hordeum vulgare]|nr:hypothetical protein ZWY2020_051585 [Hordeum vulgare]
MHHLGDSRSNEERIIIILCPTREPPTTTGLRHWHGRFSPLQMARPKGPAGLRLHCRSGDRLQVHVEPGLLAFWEAHVHIIWAGVRVDASLLDAAPSLRCVVTTAAGLDHIDLAECARRGVAVANSGEVYSTDVADHAVGLLLDVLRRVSAAERYVRRGSWPA